MSVTADGCGHGSGDQVKGQNVGLLCMCFSRTETASNLGFTRTLSISHRVATKVTEVPRESQRAEHSHRSRQPSRPAGTTRRGPAPRARRCRRWPWHQRADPHALIAIGAPTTRRDGAATFFRSAAARLGNSVTLEGSHQAAPGYRVTARSTCPAALERAAQSKSRLVAAAQHEERGRRNLNRPCGA